MRDARRDRHLDDPVQARGTASSARAASVGMLVPYLVSQTQEMLAQLPEAVRARPAKL
jgi:hypothetical protein